MDWTRLLKQHCLRVLQKEIKAHPESWMAFDNTEDMNDFLNNVIESSNNQDVRFKQECIEFVIAVFPLSSDAIRGSIISSPIMQGIYGLISDGQRDGFETIISFAKEIKEWRDLKSGLSLFQNDYKDFKSYSEVAANAKEKVLADFVNSNLLTKDLLDSILRDKEKWDDWDSAIVIITKFPQSLEYSCFLNAAIRQSEESIFDLSNIIGVDRGQIREIVLSKREINNWDTITYDYLSRDIIRPNDDIFISIAIHQSCRDLFLLYQKEFIEGDDLRVIINKKGYWDDWDSEAQLREKRILEIAEERNILTALGRGDHQPILSHILTDKDLLDRLIKYWDSNRDLYLDFPSRCWASLLARFERNGNASGQIDIIEQRHVIYSIPDEISLKHHFISLYASKGDDVFCLIDALKQGKLISQQLIEDYNRITNSSSYLSLSAIAAIKKEYNIDIRILQAANKLGLFISPDESIISLMADDFSAEDKAFGEKYNKVYFSNLDNNAKSVFGSFYETYQGLNKEQKHAVLTDEDSSLVISSAGSGKTRVIVSKYEYLTKVKKIDKEKIRILAYTKATREEINKKLGFEPNWGPARTFHSFANEIISLSGNQPQFLNDVQEEAGDINIDHAPREATLFQTLRSKGVEHNTVFMNALSQYAVSYNKIYKNRNLSFYTDKNGKIGSLKSYQEKVIFDFLAENNVEFAYEETITTPSGIVARPDFTIYHDGQFVCYYEHFAIDINKKYSPFGERYLQNSQRKIKEWGNQLIFTKGARVHDTDTIINQLKKILAERGVTLNPINPEKRIQILKEKQDYHQIFQSGIRMCLDVYDIIRETGLSMDEAFLRCQGNEYANTFMTVLFNIVINNYECLLMSNNTAGERMVDYTGLIEYATDLCDKGIINEIRWDYILIDEYQDISPLRFRFIKSLRKINSRLKICAVGDDWQSIYSFANSDLSRFKNFTTDWPYSKKLMMAETFRFNEPLLSVSSIFLRAGYDPLLEDKDVKASRIAPVSTQIEIKECNDFSHQCSLIKRILKDKEIKPNNCLILARYRADLQALKPFFDTDFSDCFMTMHASKGLTRDYVFLVNCNESVIPSQVKDDTVIKLIRGASEEDKLNEERRLFYVAITRAQIKTFVLYYDMPSSFVKELERIL